jgi:hypothetical protein
MEESQHNDKMHGVRLKSNGVVTSCRLNLG